MQSVSMQRALRSVLLWGSALVLGGMSACSSTPTQAEDMGSPDMATPQPPPGPGDGHVIDAVNAALSSTAMPLKGRTWNLSSSNLLADDWLLQTPAAATWGQPYVQLPIPSACSGAGCDADFKLRSCATQADCIGGGTCTAVAATVSSPGDAPKKLCVGHSDLLPDAMYKVLISAERYADVTSLLPPDGRFEAAMRNAVTYLGKSGRSVQLRFIFGNYPYTGGTVDTKAVLGRLTRDLQSGNKVQVYVGSYRSSNLPPSWNHSKIVAADGKVSIVGGHNLWDDHYLGKNPVHDLSIRVRGPAAVDSHLFANEQWRYTCSTMNFTYCFVTGSVCSHGWTSGSINNTCPPQVDKSQLVTDTPGDTRVLGMGRLAYIDSANLSNSSDSAFLAMLAAARTSIKIAQQDIGPPRVPLLGIPAGDWPEPLFRELGAAMVRGVDVYIVVSNKDSIAGGLTATTAGYSNGWTPQDVAMHIRDSVVASPPPGAPTGQALRDLLCQKLHVAPLRFSVEDSFPDGTPLPNHSKFVMIDDQAFYVGSQNQYDAGLTEFGYLVDDERAAFPMVQTYFAPMWQQSVRSAVSGSDATSCVIR